MEQVSSLRHYTGVHTSLYGSLDTASIANLEKAILFTEIGHYAQAHAIFETGFLTTRSVPVVVIEEAELAMQQLHYGEVYRILGRGLQAAQRSPGYDVNEPALRFMSLFQAMAAIHYKGTVTPAIEQIHRTQQWLKDVPVSEYTDIQVDVIRKYVLTVLLVSMYSHFDEPETSLIPKPTERRIPWQGLTDLRISLLNRNMLNEVLSLFRVERSRLPIAERAGAIQSVLERTESLSFQSDEQRLWMQADLKLLLAFSVNELGNVERAKLELDKADQLLKTWSQLAGIESADTLSTSLSIRFYRMEVSPEEEPIGYLNQCLSMLDVLQTAGHLRLVTCFHRATEAADKVALLTGSKGYRDLYYQLHEARQTHQETVLEDISGMLFDHADIVCDALKSTVSIRKTIEWLDGFEAKYPAFELPSGLLEIQRHRSRLHWRLGDEAKRAEAQEKLDVLKKQGPRRIGPMVGVRSTQITESIDSSAASASHASKPPAYDPDDVEEANFFMEWVDVEGTKDRKNSKIMTLLCRWLLEDFSHKVISENELRQISQLLLRDEETEDDIGSRDANGIIQLIASLLPMSAYRSLFTPGGHLPDFDSWTHSLEKLEAWLRRPSSSSSFNGRQYLFFSLQDLRKDLVYASTHSLATKISEVERCMDILPKLPKAVQELIGNRPSLWHAAIASASIISLCTPDRFVNIDAFKSEETGQILDRAELEAQKAIRMEEDSGHIYALVICQRTLAEIYLLKMHHLLLDPVHKSQLDDKLTELMEKGLAELEKVQAYQEQCLLDFTMSDKLESHNSREREFAFGLSHRALALALHLLLTGNLLRSPPVRPDDKLVERMWHWVQRSKAQSLARTMGLRNVVPSSILKDIRASEECNHLYTEMIELQETIVRSNLHERYNLRRRLEAHIDTMKQNATLKQLLGIQLGEALSYDDIEKISAASDSPVVFVDWLFLPGYASLGKILLFTAAAGRPPTIDLVSVGMEVVEEWVRDYLEDEEPDDFGLLPLETSFGRAESMARLNNLVGPLSHRTRSGDLLIFSPSSSLYRVPLHALQVPSTEGPQKQAIIRRNPIVYSHSHSILRPCFWASQLAADADSPVCSLLVHAVPDGPDDGKSSVKEISTSFASNDLEVRSLFEADATKTALVRAAPDSRLIHIHTHGWWESDDPLSHNLELFHGISDLEPAEADERTAHERGEQEADYKLTAREVFSIPLARGTHVSLIACRGGLARINQGDEVMGMVPALLASGASSTISTLWPIFDSDGAQFARLFYSHLFEERRQAMAKGSVSPGFVNLAKAFQKAVCDMDTDSREPLISWAGFIFHGFWSYYLPPGNIKT
ncbi:hypothetical protein L228DRAFT_137515 [Xylona heveae TC161]|uniref:CHAT domain-containing protein n=1 Tax=Xylona heveae (strain CBS 132557 / TC161) TaxID=1328760 RepID=A0A165H0G5_XYLHT|nr:hypothetical protein L228DRAFT_137515 [Xylona heveae TC161]KZF22832.1 hypothetical protein L228DRAFT_137515 [Xylona heveae TC161]